MKIKSLIKQIFGSGAAAIPDPDGMIASVGGTAQAIGTNTLATGQVQMQMVDKGAFSIAKGSAQFVGAAQSDTGVAAAAGATTQANVSGADFVLSLTKIKGAVSDSSAVVKSTTKVVAIDFDGWAPPGGQVTIDLTSIKFKGGGQPLAISGNIAHVGAVATATGDNSVAATTTDSLVIDNHFSAVTGGALTGIA